MARFEFTRYTSYDVEAAWSRMTNWPNHGRFVPLTTVAVDPLSQPQGVPGVGTTIVARTGSTKFGLDDPMEITAWEPPGNDRAAGYCRLLKRGRYVTGYAEFTVRPSGIGSEVTWIEDLRVWKLPRLFDPLTRFVGRIVFGYVVKGLLAKDR